MSSQPSVSLLLPNMNNGPVLDEFFEKLATNTTYPNFELVAVDDGSTDESRDILHRWRDSGRFTRFRLVEQANAGVPVTLNRAMGLADGEIFVRLDGDATIETPGWLERMLALRAVDDRVGMIVASIEFDNGRIHALGRNALGRDGLHDRGTKVLEPLGTRTNDALVHRPARTQVPFRDVAAEVDTALGCCTLFPADLAREIGGIDKRFGPVWIEDDDFGIAVRAKDRKVFLLPEVRVIHHVSRRNARTSDGQQVPRPGRIDLALRTFGAAAYNALPPTAKRPVARRFSRWQEPPSRLRLLAQHYRTWQEKWGFDPLNPDPEALRGRWGRSELNWREDAELRAAGEEILRRYRAAV